MNHSTELSARTDIAALLPQIMHGARHRHPLSLAWRVLLLSAIVPLTVWLAQSGNPGLAVVTALTGALCLAAEAVELYAAGAACERLAEQEEQR